MTRATFGLRINGIREGGKPYRSWEDAREALLRRLNTYGFERRRAGFPEEDNQRSSETLRIVSERPQLPRQNLKAHIGSRVFEVTREPF